jgi:hypothetical protein
MGLILRFRLNPSPRGLNHTDHGLPAGVDVHVLDECLAAVNHLNDGRRMSCGCIRQEGHNGRANRRHGKSGCLGWSPSRTYQTWSGMRTRCLDQNDPSYPRYGGRGISICERWSSFENFLHDMGPRPKRLTLDRIDNDGNYEPSNCRWATWAQQRANQRPSQRRSELARKYRPRDKAGRWFKANTCIGEPR